MLKMSHLLEWAESQKREWSYDETIQFVLDVSTLSLHCMVLDEMLNLSLPLCFATPECLLEKIKANQAFVYIYQSLLVIVLPNVGQYRIQVPKVPQVTQVIQVQLSKELEQNDIDNQFEIEEPVVCEPVSDDEEIDLIKEGEFYLIKGTNVIVDIEKFTVLGHIVNHELVKEQNQEVIDICKQYSLTFDM